VASLSTDLSNENRPRRGFSAISASVAPSPRPSLQKPPLRRELRETGRTRRLKLNRKPRETSHGLAIKHTIKPRGGDGDLRRTKKPIQTQKKQREDIDPLKLQKQEPEDIPQKTEVTSAETEELPTVSDPTEGIDEVETEEKETEHETEPEAIPTTDVSIEEVKRWADASWKHLSKNFKLPKMAVGQVKLDKSTILAYTTKECLPREFVNVKASVKMGPGYHNIDVDLQSDVHKRQPASIKWTKISQNAPKHLRYTSLQGGIVDIPVDL